MALPIRIARGIVGVVKEVTVGTPVEPAGADSFHAENIVIKMSQQAYEPKATRAHFGDLDTIPGMAEGEISFEILLVGSTGAGTDPFWHTSMLATGHQRVTVGATSTTYKSTTKFDGTGTTTLFPSESYSVYVWEENGGPNYRLSGCQGDFGMSAKSGEPLRLKFSYKGGYQPVIDDGSPPTVTDSALVPPTFLAANLSLHGLSAGSIAFEQFNFSKGNVLSPRINANSTPGLLSYWVTGHQPMIKINPEMLTVATHDFFARWRAGTTGAITFGPIPSGGGAGLKVAFTANRTQYFSVPLAERNGARVLDLEARITTAAAAVDGDDYSIAFT